MSSFKNILVFCGSNSGSHSYFIEAAQQLGKTIADNKSTLIYGAAKIGIMGSLADAVLKEGGKVVGIIPDFLQTKEVVHTGLTELIVVQSMHERKWKMYENCDAVFVLPGGFGTLDETFEFITWMQLGLHAKPIGLWNINGFFEGLLVQLDNMESHGFISSAHRQLLLHHESLEELWHKMEHFTVLEGSN